MVSLRLDIFSIVALFLITVTSAASNKHYWEVAILGVSVLAAVLVLSLSDFNSVRTARLAWSVALFQVALYEAVIYWADGSLNPIPDCRKLL